MKREVLNVYHDGALVSLQMQRGSKRIRCALSPGAARLVAAHLLLNAHAIDPAGNGSPLGAAAIAAETQILEAFAKIGGAENVAEEYKQ